jgi:hypothetical protein
MPVIVPGGAVGGRRHGGGGLQDVLAERCGGRGQRPLVKLGGRYWDRTSDLLGVNEALSR